jgi:plastocyanin
VRTLSSLSLILILAASSQAATITGKVVVNGVKDSRDVVVYIGKIEGKTFPAPSESRILDQIYLTFKPHVLPIQAGTRVQFPNSDEVRHNVFSPNTVDGKRFRLGTYAAGTSKDWVFVKPGVITLLCNVHIEMSAYIVVTETPYFAVTDASGAYVIKDVPPGKYTLNAWHERNVLNERRGFQSRPVEIMAAGDMVSVPFELK